MTGFGKTLRDAVRKLATKTSVDDLKKQGVKQVSVIGLDRIVQFVEEAVHRSLRSRLLLGEREAVADATREEFMKLLRTNEELQERSDRAAEEADSFRLEIQRLEQELESRIDRAETDERAHWEQEDARIQAAVRGIVRVATGRQEEPAKLEKRMLELVMNLVGTERRTTLEAKAAVSDSEVELLKRRISKLSLSLDDAESRLGRAERTSEGDDGIASVYREVQGISVEAKDVDRKRDLMAGIFAANLELQKKR